MATTEGGRRELASLMAGAVHVWHIPLTLDAQEVRASRLVLSPEELQRADRFYFDRDRNRFIAAHAAMRMILAEYLGVAPQGIDFALGLKGKPELVPALARSGIRFNLSHSHDRALLGVARFSCIGIDIERIDREVNSEEIAARFFSAHEVKTLFGLPAAQRAGAFASCWTRKEAYIKAVGDGLSLPLHSFDVAFGPGVPAALLRSELSPGEVSRWSMYDIPVEGPYAAALVVEGRRRRLQAREWKR